MIYDCRKELEFYMIKTVDGLLPSYLPEIHFFLIDYTGSVWDGLNFHCSSHYGAVLCICG